MAKKQPKLGDLVKCLWLDAYGSATTDYSQADIENAKSCVMTTYGILVRDDRESAAIDPLVGLAAEVSEDGHYRGVTFIPVGMVRSIEVPTNRRTPRTKKAQSKPLDSVPAEI